MSRERIYNSGVCFQPTDGEPIRSVIAESAEAVIVAWYVKPGQTIGAHVHPRGQDTWIILAGRGDYVCDATGSSRQIMAGDVVVARTGDVHGVTNNGTEPLSFISVVAPADSGYHPVQRPPA